MRILHLTKLRLKPSSDEPALWRRSFVIGGGAAAAAKTASKAEQTKTRFIRNDIAFRRCLVVLTALVGALVLGIQAQQAQTDWPAHGRDAGGARFSPLKQITTKNVSQLKVA